MPLAGWRKGDPTTEIPYGRFFGKHGTDPHGPKLRADYKCWRYNCKDTCTFIAIICGRPLTYDDQNDTTWMSHDNDAFSQSPGTKDLGV